MVKAFHAKENVSLRLVASAIAFVSCAFVLERGPKAFHDGIVIAVGGATHADRQVMGGQTDLIGQTRLLILPCFRGYKVKSRKHFAVESQPG